MFFPYWSQLLIYILNLYLGRNIKIQELERHDSESQEKATGVPLWGRAGVTLVPCVDTVC